MTSSNLVYRPIAVCGLAGAFPGGCDPTAFLRVLREGSDAVGPPTEQRLRACGLDLDAEYLELGYLPRIDTFDHPFFQISRTEAERMDPVQRMALELAATAIEDAGYRLSAVAGTRTAVCLAAGDSGYRRLVKVQDGKALMGRTLSATPGRIAYHLDLRGPVLLVDTSCSSSLVAVHEACVKLLTGEADLALAGGVQLYALPPQTHANPLGIGAPDGRSKAFDATADGTGAGEGGAVLLLKPLDRALEDRDRIRAVLRGSAINHDGRRSNGIASPSPTGQTEAILTAWRRADLDPETLGYVEAHGTGTELGDPVEVQALTDAFRTYTDRRGFCGLSTVKSNIGHLGAAAGVSGLVKAVLALERRELFPSVHFSTPNPHIDFAASPLYVVSQHTEWNGTAPRRAAVSSFGLTATNAHVVVEEAPRVEAETAENPLPWFGRTLVTLSAHSSNALHNYARRVLRFLDRETIDLEALAQVLNRGRDDYSVRQAFVVQDAEELKSRLFSALDAEIPATECSAQVVWLCSGAEAPSQDQLMALGDWRPFRKAFEAADGVSAVPGSPSHRFAVCYGLYELWRGLGVPLEHFLGTGVGRGVAAVAAGRSTLEEAMDGVEGDYRRPLDRERFRRVATSLLTDGDRRFFALWPGCELTARLQEEAARLQVPPPDVIQGTDRPSLVLAQLYEQGVDLDWDVLYRNHPRRRVAAPTYPFEPIRCWPGGPAPEPEPSPAEVLPAAASVEPTAAPGRLKEEGTSTERAVAEVWGEVLQCEALSLDDDFFELGGTSLDAGQLTSRLWQRFQVEVDFELVWDLATVRELAAEIDRRRGRAPAAPTEAIIPPREHTGPAPLSFAQERLFHFYRLAPESSVYNMPGILRLDGPLSVTSLDAALATPVRRHEVLRTVYELDDGSGRQRVGSAPDASLPVIDLDRLGTGDLDAEALRLARAWARRPFRLDRETSLRIVLLRRGDAVHELLFNFHHIASDGWSLGVFFRELEAAYQGVRTGQPDPLEELSIQYADFAVWQRRWLSGDRLREQLNQWRRLLADPPERLVLDLETSRPAVQSFRGDVVQVELKRNLLHRLDDLARREKASRFMVLLGGFMAVLGRHTRQDRFVVGTPVANRARTELEPLMGFFANTLPLPADLGGDPSFSELLVRVRDTVVTAFAHQDVPIEMLVEEFAPPRSTAYSPLFQVVFALQNASMETPELPALDLSLETITRDGAKFDLTLSLLERNRGLLGDLVYPTDLFERADVESLADHYLRLLEGVANDPSRPLSTVPLMSAPRQRELLDVWRAETAEPSDYDFDS